MNDTTPLVELLTTASEELLALARAHRSVIPPPTFTAEVCATLGGKLRRAAEVLSRGVLATVDWSQDTATAEVAALSDTSRAVLLEALRAAGSVDADRYILAVVRDALARDAAHLDPIGVVFRTMEFDDGSYLTEAGEVWCREQQPMEPIDFAGLDDTFTHEFGRRGDDFALVVNLTTGTVEGFDYSADAYESLGIQRVRP